MKEVRGPATWVSLPDPVVSRCAVSYPGWPPAYPGSEWVSLSSPHSWLLTWNPGDPCHRSVLYPESRWTRGQLPARVLGLPVLSITSVTWRHSVLNHTCPHCSRTVEAARLGRVCQALLYSKCRKGSLEDYRWGAKTSDLFLRNIDGHKVGLVQ